MEAEYVPNFVHMDLFWDSLIFCPPGANFSYSIYLKQLWVYGTDE